MKRVGVAVVGVGFWGQNHVRLLSHMPNARLLGVHDVDRVRAQQVSVRFGVEKYDRLVDLLRVKGLDAVCICTQTQAHGTVAERALEARKHVFLEKPMTGDSTQAARLVRLAGRNGTVLMVGFVERFNQSVRKARELVASGQLGKIILVGARRVMRWARRTGDVGVVRDVAIHDIDAMMSILDSEIREVYASVGSIHRGLEDYAQVMLSLENGATGFVDANWLTPRKIRSLVVTGTEATFSLDYLTQEYMVEDQKGSFRPAVTWQEPLKLELEHFINCVLSGRKPEVPGEDGVRALRVCDAILESGHKKRIVNVHS